MKRPWAVACLGYIAGYLALTYPLVWHPTERIVANHLDGFVDLLLFWYARTGHLFAPWSTDLFHPHGAAVAADHGFWLVPLLSVPFQYLGGPAFAFNVLSLGFFAATGTAMFVLARAWGVRSAGAFLAGALLLLSPSYLEEMLQGIPETMGLQWLVGFLWCAWRLREESTWGLRLGCATFLALTWLGSWYCGVFALLFLPALGWRRLGWPLVGAALVVAGPLLAGASSLGVHGPSFQVSVAHALLNHEQGVPEPSRTRVTEADMAPLVAQKVIGESMDFSGMLARHRPSFFRDALPGWLLIGLAMLGAANTGRRALPWLGLAAVFVFASLGPLLMWRGHAVATLPTAWLYEHVRAAASLRPDRFLLPAVLCLSLLAGAAVPDLSSRWARGAMAGFLVSLQLLELFVILQDNYTVQLASTRVPAFYQRLAASPSRGALIEVPLVAGDVAAGQHLFYQTVHRRPLLNYDFVRFGQVLELGRLAGQNPIIGWLVGGEAAATKQDAAGLRAWGFETLILHAQVDETGRERPADLFFPAELFDRLRGLYGEPANGGDGILAFDLRRTEGENRPGATVRLRVADAAVEATPSCCETTWCTLACPAEVTELRAWGRGLGGTLSLRVGGRRVATASLDGAWRWIRLGIPPGRDAGDPLNLVVTASPTARVEVAGGSYWSPTPVPLRGLKRSSRRNAGRATVSCVPHSRPCPAACN